MSRKERVREVFDERGKIGAFGCCRRGGEENGGGMELVVRASRKLMGESVRLAELELAGAGKGREGASDSEEEDSSEELSSSSSDSVGWSGMILGGTRGTVGDGTELSESDQNDGGRCD